MDFDSYSEESMNLEDMQLMAQSQEFVEIKNSNVSITNVARTFFSNEMTQLLLDLYGENLNNVGPLKKFRNKKQMWTKFAKIISDKFNIVLTDLQVKYKFENVMKKCKSTINNNPTNGATRQSPPVDNVLDKTLKEDNSLLPEIMIDRTCFSKEMTQFLLDLYAENLGNVGPLKKFLNKKQMWIHFAKIISDKYNIVLTDLQVKYKLQSMRKETSGIKNNRRSGLTRQSTAVDKELDEIIADDPLLPEIMIDSGSNLRDSETLVGQNKKLSRKRNFSTQEKFMEKYFKLKRVLHEEKEQNKERRHNEKLRKLDELIKILKK